jgi:hypothetical protein
MLGHADDRRRHSGLAQNPRERDLNRQHTLVAGDVDDRVGDIVVGIGVVEAVTVVVVLLAQRRILFHALPIAGQKAARERAPWDQPDTFGHA